jgi:succinoglycan biosynthesis protein ExoV
MNILSTTVKGGNFGDDLNNILWDLLPKQNKSLPEDEAILGIGTHHYPNIQKNIKKIHIFGCGSYLEDSTNWIGNKQVEIHFVRGPLTAKNWHCETKALTDSAILMLLTNLKDVPCRNSKKVGYIPHHRSSGYADFQRICDDANIEFIDTRCNDLKKFISQVKSCEFVITEALHGAIVADIFRKPWVPVKSASYINGFKWADWCQSINLIYNPKIINSVVTRGIRPINRVENALKRSCALLNLGKARWREKRVMFDSHDKEMVLARQLDDIRNQSDWMLSNDKTLDNLIDRAGEAWFNFSKTLV